MSTAGTSSAETSLRETTFIVLKPRTLLQSCVLLVPLWYDIHVQHRDGSTHSSAVELRQYPENVNLTAPAYHVQMLRLFADSGLARLTGISESAGWSFGRRRSFFAKSSVPL